MNKTTPPATGASEEVDRRPRDRGQHEEDHACAEEPVIMWNVDGIGEKRVPKSLSAKLQQVRMLCSNT